jgi:peptidoglycan/LPS O-acetylase OafA/YrhL
MDAVAPTERRVQSLDVLRGLAILMVLGSHYAAPVLPAWCSGPALAGVGRGGVILFFLLSGYLIYRNVQRQPIPAFVMRRLFKILPSYWLNLALFAALDWSLADAGHFPGSIYLTNFLMIADVTHDPPVSAVYWTLLIEIKFYLFIALQFAVLKDRFLGATVAGLIALSLVAFAARGHGNMLLSFFPAFYVGAYIHRAQQQGWRSPAVAALAVVTLASATGMLLTLPDLPAWSAACLVLAVVAVALFLRAQLGNRPFARLGATSYSNYLYHSMIGSGVFALMGATALAAMVAFAAAIAVAAALYRLVEQPMVRLGRRQEASLLGLPGAAIDRALRDPAAS